MSYLDTALGIAGGAARAMGGFQSGHPQPAPGGGEMMKYMRGRQYGMQPNGTRQATPGLPQGMQIPGSPTPPMVPPPSMTPPMTQQGQYGNPYPRTPPVMDGQRFASGGVVDKPTTAIIGEDGPEMVIPLSGRADARVSPRNVPGMSYGRG